MKFVRFLLFPFAFIYYLITSIRNYFYNTGILKSQSFSIPIIVVGNLSVGGTGKTPQIEYLIKLLKDQFKTAVLSRGYKRKTSGFILLNKNHKVDEVGDEPMQYFKKFDSISVAVDEQRVRGVQHLLNLKSPDVVLLDDAYQHRKIEGSYYILLTKYDDLFTRDFLLPVGNLRESRIGAKRADCIVVTKCPNSISHAEIDEIKGKLSKYCSSVYFSSIAYSDRILRNSEMPIEELKDHSILLITGIANPNPLIEFLNYNRLEYSHLKFSDHHHFSEQEIQSIQAKFDAIQSEKKIILTTEKDYVRLVNKLKLSYLPIKTTILGESEQFDSAILNHIVTQNKQAY